MKIINCPSCGGAERPADNGSDVCQKCEENKTKRSWTQYVWPTIIVTFIAAVLGIPICAAYCNATRPYPAEVLGVSMHYNRGPVYQLHLKDPRWYAIVAWTVDVPEGVYRTFNAGDHWPTDYDRATMQRRLTSAEKENRDP